MLVFVDESWQTNTKGIKVASLAGVAMPEETYNEFARRIFNIKRHRFEITSHPRHMTLTVGTQRLLTTPYSYLMERIDRYMMERFPGRVAKILFDSRGLGTDEPLAVAFSNFLFRSSVGQQYTRILATPFFVVSRLKPGIQVADVFAYIASQVLDGRPECQPYYQRLQDLQWVSKDGQMRGVRYVK